MLSRLQKETEIRIPYLEDKSTPRKNTAWRIIMNYKRDYDIFRYYNMSGNLYISNVQDIQDVILKNTTHINSEFITSEENKNFVFEYVKRLGPKGKVGTPYVFKCDGNDVIFKESLHIDTESQNYIDREDLFKCLKNPGGIHPSCVKHEYPHIFVGSSEYVNEIIIGFILNSIFFPNLMQYQRSLNDLCLGRTTDDDAGFSVFQLGYFQARDMNNKLVGYNVMEKADGTIDKVFTDINNINSPYRKIKIYDHNNILVDNTNFDNVISHVLHQIIIALYTLSSQYDFFHGDLKAGNVFYKIDDWYLENDNLLNGHISNIRIKIADYGKCSITYENKRYFCREAKAQYIVDTFVKSFDVTKEMENNMLTKNIIINGNNKVIHLYLYNIHELFELRHSGCPTFKTIDLYILIVSLCLQSVYFYDFCKRKGIIMALFGEDIPITTTSDRPESVNTANHFLLGKYLVCEAFELITELLSL